MTRRKQYLRALLREERLEHNRFRLWEATVQAEEVGDLERVRRLERAGGKLWGLLCSAGAEVRHWTPEELTCGSRGAW